MCNDKTMMEQQQSIGAALVWTYVLVILTQQDLYASSLTVTVSKSAEKAVLGDNPFTISCTYTFTSGVEQIFAIELKRKREIDNYFVNIVIFPNPTSLLNVSYGDTSLESRTVATNPTDNSKTATLEFSQIDCNDKATYRWSVLYTDGQVQNRVKDLSFVVKANTRFKDDGSVSLSQNTNIAEGDKIVFTCSGDVGNEPVGHLSWFYYLNKDTSSAINASRLAQSTTPVYQSSTCSYRRTSTLELTMTRSFHNIVVRCTVQQDRFDEFGNGFVQTNKIPVYYSPKITSIQDQTVKEGKKSLELRCVADAYPLPFYYWVLPDGTVSEGPSYNLSNLQLSDSGPYICVVYNTYKGVNHTVNETSNINVYGSETVTTSPTKAITTSTTSTTDITIGNSSWCFDCIDMSHLKYCDKVRPCVGEDQVCFVQSYMRSLNVQLYKSGCIDKKLCQPNGQTGCLQCCEGSFCNTQGCGDNGINDLVNRGPVCFDCNHRGENDICKTVQLCAPNEKCIVEKYKWGSGDFHYVQGCATSCGLAKKSVLYPYGKRHVPFCTKCCSSDYCNDNCTAAISPAIIG